MNLFHFLARVNIISPPLPYSSTLLSRPVGPKQTILEYFVRLLHLLYETEVWRVWLMVEESVKLRSAEDNLRACQRDLT